MIILHFTLNYDISRKIILRATSKCYSTYIVVGNQGVVSTDLSYYMNIPLRRSRDSGVAGATCPEPGSHSFFN